MVRHDNRVRVPSAILNLGLAVFRWIFGPSREARTKNVIFAGTLGVDPLKESIAQALCIRGSIIPVLSMEEKES